MNDQTKPSTEQAPAESVAPPDMDAGAGNAEGFTPMGDPPVVAASAIQAEGADPTVKAQDGLSPSSGGAGATAQNEPETDESEVERQARLATEAALAAVASSAASQKMDTLSGLVLDAAELANRSAASSAAAGAKLLETHTALEAELAKARRQSKIVLGVAGGIAVVSVVLTAAIVTQVASRMAKLDATVLAVGKRYVEMSAGLESLTLLNDSLAEMQVKQDAFAQLQAKLSANLEEASKASQGLVTQVPQATAKEVQSRTAALMQQVQSMDSRVQAQAASMKKMADEVKAMQGQQENLGALKRDVEALVVLQRERYLEAAKSAGVATAKGPVVAPAPRTVQYPRPQPPETAPAPATSAAPPAVSPAAAPSGTSGR
jgi:hypothetical protein